MDNAAVRSKVVVLLFKVPPIVVGVLWSLFWYALLHVLSSKQEIAGCSAFIFFWMSCYCKCFKLFLMVPWVDLQFVIVVFPDHTHLLFDTLLIDDESQVICPGCHKEAA